MTKPFCWQALTVPNLVTLTRPLLCGPFMWYGSGLTGDRATACITAIVLYGVVLISDVLDGHLARRWGQSSPFGRMLDHLCDVTFILLALFMFGLQGIMPWWPSVAIAWSFGMYAIHSWAQTSNQLQRTFVASTLGHWGGILYYATVGIVLVDRCLLNSITQTVILYGWFELITLLAIAAGAERLHCLLRVSRSI